MYLIYKRKILHYCTYQIRYHNMKKLFVLLTFLSLASCSVEQRIKDYSYTNEWHYTNDGRYQVYQTKGGKKYIIIINKKETKLPRKYIK
jgi:hypothetical protein